MSSVRIATFDTAGVTVDWEKSDDFGPAKYVIQWDKSPKAVSYYDRAAALKVATRFANMVLDNRENAAKPLPTVWL